MQLAQAVLRVRPSRLARTYCTLSVETGHIFIPNLYIYLLRSLYSVVPGSHSMLSIICTLRHLIDNQSFLYSVLRYHSLGEKCYSLACSYYR